MFNRKYWILIIDHELQKKENINHKIKRNVKTRQDKTADMKLSLNEIKTASKKIALHFSCTMIKHRHHVIHKHFHIINITILVFCVFIYYQ